MSYTAAVITVSDKGARDERIDTSGPALCAVLKDTGWEMTCTAIHQNPSDRCIVGQHIRPVLTGMFTDAEDAFTRALAGKTLADCIGAIRKEMEETAKPDQA